MDSEIRDDRDQACNECRRRKARCDKILPECGPCKKNRREYTPVAVLPRKATRPSLLSDCDSR